MKKRYVLTLFTIFSVAILTGCTHLRPVDKFTPYDLHQEFTSGQYTAKIDNFIIILDASASMGLAYNGKVNKGHSKFVVAKDIISRLNETMPQIGINGTLMTFGSKFLQRNKYIKTVYGPTEYTRAGLKTALESLSRPTGNSPAGLAIKNSGNTLGSSEGNNAIILVSDGDNLANNPLMRVRDLKKIYGDKMCFYTIWTGNNKDGRELLQRMSDEMNCGYSVTIDDISTAKTMGDFVKSVFLTTSDMQDSDGDGVPDNLDKCPGTRPGVEVDEWGCPKVSKLESLDDLATSTVTDSDGDGVFDEIDECPDTPYGAIVDHRGCWVVKGIKFDYKKSDIKPKYNSNLKNIVKILENDPGLKIRIEGHTDTIGSMNYNIELSERRAIAVKNYLVNMGINGNRITTKGFAYTKPIASNETEAGRAMNRRAELIPIKE